MKGLISREFNYIAPYISTALSLSIFFTLFAFVCFVRPIDADEGLYQYAAAALSRGKLPYLDFFYPQLPLLMPIYSVLGRSLLLARALSVIFSSLTVIICLNHLRRQSPWTWGATVLLATHSYFLLWGTVFKSYPLTMLLSMLGIYFIVRGSQFQIFLAGAFLGLAAGARLYYGVICAIWLAILIMRRKEQIKRVFWFSTGLAISALPTILFIVQAPTNFWVHCIWVHRIRSDAKFLDDIWQKVSTLWEILLDPQWLIILFLVVLGYGGVRGTLRWLALSSAVALALMSVFTSPTYSQYFVCVLPFLVPFIGSGLSALHGYAGKKAVGGICLLYLLSSPLMYMDYTGRNYDGRASMQTTAKVLEVIQSNLKPGSSFFTFFPGFAAWSDTIVPTGFESTWGYVLGKYVEPKLRDRTRFADEHLAERYIESRGSELVLLGEYPLSQTEIAHFKTLLLKNGYKQILSCSTWQLYSRKVSGMNPSTSGSLQSEDGSLDLSSDSCIPSRSIISILGPQL